MDNLEQFWADLMSGAPERVRRAWTGLTDKERQVVRGSLTQIRDGDGWHPSQREAANAALQIAGGPSQPLPGQPQ